MSGGSSKWLSEAALAALRSSPRVSLRTLQPPIKTNPLLQVPKEKQGGKSKGFGRSGKSFEARQSKLAANIGFEWCYTPMAYRIQKEPQYNYGYSAKRQYPPLSLKTLQLLIDTERIDPSQPIDLAALCNSKALPFNPHLQQFGFNLTDEGADCFKAKVNLEVQWANEQAIAAVERNGGVITTAYFDILSVKALANPAQWFAGGHPVPRRMAPPQDCVGFYTAAENRGYLADPRAVAEHRAVLGQKYGYEPPQVTEDLLRELKDPRQVFYGMQAGWLVDLKDKVIYKPTDKDLKEFYGSS